MFDGLRNHDNEQKNKEAAQKENLETPSEIQQYSWPDQSAFRAGFEASDWPIRRRRRATSHEKIAFRIAKKHILVTFDCPNHAPDNVATESVLRQAGQVILPSIMKRQRFIPRYVRYLLDRAAPLAIQWALSGLYMELRNHQLVSYRGIRSWPPIWVWIDGGEKRNPRGEVGVLTEVRESNVSSDRLFLIMDYLGSSYMGCLLFDDRTFCDQIAQLVTAHRGERIADIGGLDVSYLL